MRRIIPFIIIAVFIAAAVAVDSVITEFTVSAVDEQAVLKWKSGIEGNLTKYKIERSTDGQNFSYIWEVLPEGNYSEYEYIDSNLFKTTSQRIYYYRIKMIFADNTYTYSEVKSVTIFFSGLSETWGSIKAMFR